jgi:tRNA(adenine34) deaminase
MLFSLMVVISLLRCVSSVAVQTADKHSHFMKLALRHAQHAFREKEVPIGAVLVDEDGIVVAAARNRVEALCDATAHAEMECLRRASKIKGNWRLLNCTLYTTLEPCTMCASALQSFRVKKVVYAAPDRRLGGLGSWVDLVGAKHPFHELEVESGVCAEESALLLKRFFQMRRREKKESESELGSIVDTISSRGADYGNKIPFADTPLPNTEV